MIFIKKSPGLFYLSRLMSFAFFLLIVGCHQEKGSESEADIIARPANEYKSLTKNGAWCWFSDPRAVFYEGEHRRTYTGWVDNFGNIHVAFYDHQTGEMANHIVKDTLEIDDHNNPSILIDQQGRLLVFFNMHMMGDQPLFMVKAEQPESISSWGPVRELFLNDSSLRDMGRLNHTYTNPVQLSAEDGRIYLFWRGVDGKPSFSFSDDTGETWSKGRIIFMPERIYSFRRPYTKVYSDGKKRIHFTFTDGHPRKEEDNSIYYMYYEGGNFYKADGSHIKKIENLPVRPQDADLVYDASGDKAKAWNWDIAADDEGNSVIVYAKFPDDSNHVYCYSRWDGDEWLNHELINSGGWFPETPEGVIEPEPNYSGGLNIDHENPNTLYLSVSRNDTFEIERWTTSDGGANWEVDPVTKRSSGHNVRPFAVRGAQKGNPLQVLWMHNNQYPYFAVMNKFQDMGLEFEDRFDTEIKMGLMD